MARFRGDNGKPDDTSLKDVLSPYEADRSALTDAVKLAHSRFPCTKAVLIYGFEYPDRSLDPCIDAFETLARKRRAGARLASDSVALVHPVHKVGRVFAWEIGRAMPARWRE